MVWRGFLRGMSEGAKTEGQRRSRPSPVFSWKVRKLESWRAVLFNSSTFQLVSVTSLVRSAARSLALRARGFRAISSGDGVIGFLVRIRSHRLS